MDSSAAYISKLRDFANAPREGKKVALWLTRVEARELLLKIAGDELPAGGADA